MKLRNCIGVNEMGDRYYITGVQLGLIEAMIKKELGSGDVDNTIHMLSEIITNQYMGDVGMLEKMQRSLKFVEHIERHIINEPLLFNESRPDVICKICNKTIYEIEDGE